MMSGTGRGFDILDLGIGLVLIELPIGSACRVGGQVPGA